MNLDSIKVLDNWVLLENPFNPEAIEREDKELDNLPPSQREIKARESLAKYSYLKVLKTGDNCKSVSIGDTVFTATSVLDSAIYTNDYNWMLIRESSLLMITNYDRA